MKLWTWDLEAYSWDQVCCAVMLSEDGDLERFTGTPREILEKVSRTMKKSKGTFCGHYAGGYDTPLLLNVHKFQKIVLTGSNILCAEDTRRLKVRDTYPWFLCSLAKLGEALGMSKGKVDRGALELLTIEEIVEYCTQDCRILLAGVQAAQELQESFGVKRGAWTAGSSAIAILQSLEPASADALRRNTLLVSDVQKMLQVVRGGRVECFARGRVSPVYCYDIKSSYPARYANDLIPLGGRELRPGDWQGCVFRGQWEWPHRFQIPPALDDASMTGVGLCEAWLTAEEVDCFRELGVSVRILEGFAPDELAPIGQTFAREMYAAKEASGPTKAFTKVWLNSLHGKYAEDPLKEAFTAWKPEPGKYVGPEPDAAGSWWRYFEVNSGDSLGLDGVAKSYAQPLAAATILGRARVALWRIDHALQKAGWKVFYNDTDSVMTDCPPEKMPVPLGKELGQLNFEGGPYDGLFLGPKAYLILQTAESLKTAKRLEPKKEHPEIGKPCKQALKGIPLKALEKGIIGDWTPQHSTRVYKNVYREAPRPSPENPNPEKGTDLRAQVFEQALTDPSGVNVLKDGITSFLRGLSGVKNEETGTRDSESWKRAPFVRNVRPSGRGKLFTTSVDPCAWGYLTTLELVALEIVRELPMSRARWMQRSEFAREWLLKHEYVAVYDGFPDITQTGLAWLQKMGGGDLPPPDLSDELHAEATDYYDD